EVAQEGNRTAGATALATDDHGLVAGGVPAGRDHADPRQDLALALGPAGRVEEAAGMVEVKVAQRHDVDGGRLETRLPEGRQDRIARVAPHIPGLVAQSLADPGLDQDPTGGRLDEQAVERVPQPVVEGDLVDGEPVPENPWNRAQP